MDKMDFCGIEVSAKELVVALRRHGSVQRLRSFPNHPAGYLSLIRYLSTPEGVVRICLEATGLYGLDLALALHAAGFQLMVANPRAVRHFATALMERSKTDRLDA